MAFKKLGLISQITQAVTKLGYKDITPIQEKAIPAILSGHDVLAKAQTGTGKTAAFVLPVLQLLTKTSKQECPLPRVLILVPTRELAAQVEKCVCDYGQNLDIKSLSVFGGVPLQGQLDGLKQNIDILVATPGRLLELIELQAVNLSEIEILILDEADRMLAMGFIQAIDEIVEYLPEKRQNLLFTATDGKEVRKFIARQLSKPKAIEALGEKIAADKVKQLVYFVPPNRKRDLLAHLLSENDWEQILVFTRTKRVASQLTRQLNDSNIKTTVLHADKSQNARTKALAAFKQNEFRVLVATDIAARGLDIKNLPCVVNFELPNTPKDYIHRIGRTGRAGAEGTAISLVASNEKSFLEKIEKLLDWNIKRKSAGSFPHLGTPEEYLQKPKTEQRKKQTSKQLRAQKRKRRDWK